MMHINRLIYIFIFLMLLTASGCALFTPPETTVGKSKPLEISPVQKDEVEDKAAEQKIKEIVEKKKIEIPPNAYFYYMQSHMDQRRNNIESAVQNLKSALSLDPQSDFLQKELISLYLINEKYEEALKLVETMLLKNPENVDALLIFGSIKHKMRDMKAAVEAYEKAVKLDPERKNAFLNLGGMYMDSQQWLKAKNIFQSYVYKYPDDYTGHFFLGKNLLQLDEIDSAEKSFNKTVELEPVLEEPRFELIKINKNRRNQDEKAAEKIESLYYEILNQNPDNVKAALELALFLIENGNGKKADEVLAELFVTDELIPDIIQYLIKTYMNEKGYPIAISIGERLLDHVPDNPDLNYLVGLAYHEMKDYDPALNYFDNVGPGSNFYRNAIIHTAYIYQKTGELDNALKTLEKAVEIKPKDPEFLMYIGSFYEEMNKYEKAAETYKKGIEADPGHIHMNYRLGVLLDKFGDKEGTIEQMKKVIGLDPKHANALNYLGYTYADLGIHLEEAELLIKRAVNEKPKDGYIIDSLGWVYYKMGDYEKALEYITKALEKVPNDPVVLEHMGDVYLKMQHPEKAREYYFRSIELKKEGKEDLEKKIMELYPGALKQVN